MADILATLQKRFDENPALMAAGAGALGGAALGGLTGLGGKSKGRIGRILRRGLGGALLGGGAGYGGMLLKNIMDVRAAKANPPAAMNPLLGAAQRIRKATSPVWDATIGRLDDKGLQMLANSIRSMSYPDPEALRQIKLIEGENAPIEKYVSDWMPKPTTVLSGPIAGMRGVAKYFSPIGEWLDAKQREGQVDADAARTLGLLKKTKQVEEAAKAQAAQAADAKQKAQAVPSVNQQTVEELLDGVSPEEMQAISDQASRIVDDNRRRQRLSPQTVESIPGLLEMLQQEQ